MQALRIDLGLWMSEYVTDLLDAGIVQAYGRGIHLGDCEVWKPK